MKIFYAIQATGNGHISRAEILYPYLLEYGEIDFFLSGNNSQLCTNSLPIKYKSTGCSLYYTSCGSLDYYSIVKNFDLFKLKKLSNQLPLKKYDLIINDFDLVTSMACKTQKVNSIHFGHQASFISSKVPRPEKKNIMGENILKNFVKSSYSLGLHFKKYDENIFPPVISDEIIRASPKNKGHVTIYLPSFKRHCIENFLYSLNGIEFHWFLSGITNIVKHKNVTFYPIDKRLFTASLIDCHGIITGAGFETPAEAIYLGKKIISIPIQKHYEQLCNAAALKKMGITVLECVNDSFTYIVQEWFHNSTNDSAQIDANNIKKTLEEIMDLNSNISFKNSLVYDEDLMFI